MRRLIVYLPQGYPISLLGIKHRDDCFEITRVSSFQKRGDFAYITLLIVKDVKRRDVDRFVKVRDREFLMLGKGDVGRLAPPNSSCQEVVKECRQNPYRFLDHYVDVSSRLAVYTTTHLIILTTPGRQESDDDCKSFRLLFQFLPFWITNGDVILILCILGRG